MSTASAASSAESTVVLRYIFRGESLRNGRVIPLEHLLPGASSVRGEILLAALSSEEANVPQEVVPFFYHKQLEGWRRLHHDSQVIADNGRIEVLLEAPANPASTGNHSSRRSQALREQEGRRRHNLASGAVAVAGDDEAIAAAMVDMEADAGFGERGGGGGGGGYFGIGIYNSKQHENVGTLWRSAYMLDANFIFTIGNRNTWEKSADTHKTWRTVPAFRYEDWAAFCSSAPYQCTWVAVEMGGTPLHTFEHPERAVYLLGAEDAGLPPAVVRACHKTVSLEGVRASSYNVSVAGSLIMYDRLSKQQRRAGGGGAHAGHAGTDHAVGALGDAVRGADRNPQRQILALPTSSEAECPVAE